MSPAFNNNCTAPCTVLTCSCTQSTQAKGYWSSSSFAYDPQWPWLVFFNWGYSGFYTAAGSEYVRAVRGGS